MSSGRTDETHDLVARLDAAYVSWASDLTSGQRSALRRWQGMDRRYEAIQAAFRGGDVPESLRVEIRQINDAIGAGALPFDISVWKGIRSVRRTLGVSPEHLVDAVGLKFVYQGFVAATVSRGVATPDFTHPPAHQGLPSSTSPSRPERRRPGCRLSETRRCEVSTSS